MIHTNQGDVPLDTPLARGKAALARGDHAAAAEAFREALRANPSSVEAHANLAIALDALGRSEEALLEFLDAVRCGQSNVSTHLNLATYFYKRGRYAIALDAYCRARELAPNDPDVLAGIGATLYRMGSPSAALEHLDFAKLARPDDAAIWINLGRVHGELGEIAQAIHALRRAAVCAPGDARTRRDLGLLLYAAGRLHEAREELETACTLDPRDAEAHCLLGTVLRQSGHTDGACAHLREATRLAPNEADYWVELALAEEATGRYVDAARVWDIIADVHPEHLARHPDLRESALRVRRLAVTSQRARLVVPPTGPLGFGCALCRATPRSRAKLPFELKRVLFERSHESYALMVCRECRQSYLERWVEISDWSNTRGDDWWRHWVPLLGSEVAEIDAAFPEGSESRGPLTVLDRLIHVRRRLTEHPDGGFAWSDVTYTADDLVVPG